MNNLYEKIFNSMDYKTYKKIENILLFSSCGIGTTNAIINLNNIDGFSGLGILSFILYLSYLFLDNSSGVKYTKDVKEIRNLYIEFINNYNKMNKIFGFNEPVSIYVMFNYLVNKGYLSKDKNFEFKNNKDLTFSSLRGADVLNGSGVCRHITSMLTDILNNNQICACNVGVYSSSDYIDFFPLNKNQYSRENNITLINRYVVNKKERDYLINYMDFFYNQGVYLGVRLVRVKDESIIGRIYGNHLITYALYNDKNYYLDPTQSRILRLNNNNELWDDDVRLIIKTGRFDRLNHSNDNVDTYDLKKNMLVPRDSISLEEESKIKLSTLEICEDNIDIFEKFYYDNSELYNEMSDKLVKIRKK